MSSSSTHGFLSLRLASLAVMTASIAALAACGGGGGDSTPTPPPPPPAPTPAPTFTSATATTTAYNAPALVTVNGTNLDSSLVVTSPTCTGMTRLTAAPSTSTSTTAYYNCTLAAYSGTVTIASATGSSLGTAAFSLPAPTVTSAFATATKYGAPALVTVIGTNLDSSNGLTPVPTGCKSVSLVTQAPTVSSSTTAYYQCTVSGAYSGSLVLKDGFGTVLNSSATFTVLPPIVTLAVSNGLGVSGNIVIALAADKAPKTVDNFLAYVNTGFYNNVIFHRVVPGFIMQSGGYQANVTNVSTAPIKTPTFASIAVEQSGLSNVINSIAMANNGQTLGTNSQFFFNLANNTSLDGGYSVFGAITSGANVLTEILAAPATCVGNSAAGTTDCLPIPNVVISSATQTQ